MTNITCRRKASGLSAEFLEHILRDESLVLLRLFEVAHLLCVTPGSLSTMVCRGKFPVRPAIQRGRRKLWRLRDIRTYLEREQAETAARLEAA